ncbi:MAG: pitrilysin family protein [Bacteroidota bacterium]
MIEFSEFTLENGLQVIVHEDPTVEITAFNVLYKVGSKDESEDKTGFAHLFEHLMFGGSKHIPDYDGALQLVGGENNAFTNPDITNYYITLPTANIETAFWLESDRMLSLDFNPKVLEVQRSVVIEEFKQRYLNQPYGDLWLRLRPLAYKKHPYKWATIGKEISHIEDASMEDVKDFFSKFYAPNNAILSVAGNLSTGKVKELAHKWFADISSGPELERPVILEPPQVEKRFLEIKGNVPTPMLVKVFHMPGRRSVGYYAADLLSDILGRGKSSRLYKELVKGKEIFSEISAHVTGSKEPGLLVITGKLNKGLSLKEGEEEIDKVINNLLSKGIKSYELEKVKNKAQSTILFGNVEILNRAMNLAYSAFLGDINLVNTEGKIIEETTKKDVMAAAGKILKEENSSVVYYLPEK